MLRDLPVFPDNTPQLLRPAGRHGRSPGHWQADPAAMTRLYATHPPAAAAMAILKQHPRNPGFADSVFSGLNAFYVDEPIRCANAGAVVADAAAA